MAARIIDRLLKRRYMEKRVRAGISTSRQRLIRGNLSHGTMVDDGIWIVYQESGIIIIGGQLGKSEFRRKLGLLNVRQTWPLEFLEDRLIRHTQVNQSSKRKYLDIYRSRGKYLQEEMKSENRSVVVVSISLVQLESSNLAGRRGGK